MRRRTFLGAASGVVVGQVPVGSGEGQPAGTEAVPQVVPALREWVAGSQGFSYRAGCRLVVDPGSAGALNATADVFAEDLESMFGIRPAVVAGSRADAASGDIWLTLTSANVPDNVQGYRLEVAAVVTIAGRAATGVFYGTRTVLQLLKQSAAVPGGVARDWPTYPDRGVHIDTNQRRFSWAWWRNLVRDLAFVKLNQISVMLYLKGFTDAEKAELVAFAARYHVDIVPVVSMPNHTGGTLNAERPDLALRTTEQPAADSLDFTKQGALDVMRAWIERDIGKFPGRFWHTGADEFLNYPDRSMNWAPFPQFQAFARSVTGNPNAQPQDAFTWVLNWINGVVKEHGKVLRLWNDQLQTGGVVPLDPDIVVEHWYQPVGPNVYSPQQLLSRGNPVLNFGFEYLYYDMGRNFPDPRRIYDEFRVTRFHGGEVARQPGLRGARLATWMFQLTPSTPVEDNNEMYDRILPPLRSLAQVCWDSPKFADFAGFQLLADRLGNAPGYLPLTDTVDAEAAVLRDPFGRITATARVGDQVRYAVQATPAGGFGSATTIGSGLAGTLVATADRDGRAVFFARTTAGALIHGWQTQPGTGQWTTRQLATGVAGRPAVVLDQIGRLSYFVRTTDGGLRYGRQTEPGSSGGAWTASQPTSAIAGDPVATMDGFGRVLYFVRTTAGELRHGWQVTPNGDAFRDDILSTGIAGEPAVILDNIGKVLYFVRTTAGELRHGWQVNVATGPWNNTVLATGVTGHPVLRLDRQSRVLYFIRTVDNRLLHGWQTQPGQGPWGSGPLTTDLVGDPAVTVDPSGRVVYFVRTTGGGLFHGWQTTPSSGPWNGALLATGVSGDPTTAVDRSGRLTYLVPAAGGTWFGWQDTPGSGPWQRLTLPQ